MNPDKEPGGKRAQVANACLACRTAKLKCSGEHPQCTRCIDRALLCEYDTSEGRTKRQQLRQDLNDRQEELERAMAVLSHLQYGSDNEAANCLAHLRMGSSIESEFMRIQNKRWSPAQTPGEKGKSQQSPPAGEASDDGSVAMQTRALMRPSPPHATETQRPTDMQTSWARSSGSRDRYAPSASSAEGPPAQNWDDIDIDPAVLNDTGAALQDSKNRFQ